MSQRWLEQHLETFVRPHLGYIPEVDKRAYILTSFDAKILTALEVLWEQAKKKAKGKPILLPGRDVWLFEAIARSESDNYPTVVRPEISSPVAQAFSRWGRPNEFKGCVCIDTGYIGTVPRGLQMDEWYLITCSGYGPEADRTKKEHQLFPGQRLHSPTARACSVLETSSKYWNRGYMVGDVPHQELWTKEEFKVAAMLTRHVIENLFPRSVRSYGFSTGRVL